MISIVDDNHNRVDGLLLALAHPARRRVIDALSRGPQTAGELYQAFPIAGPAMSRHLRVLRQAGLVSQATKTDDGRVRVYSLQPERLAEITCWISELSSFWEAQLGAFKRSIEAEAHIVRPDS
jgi:DNA-binding transcriptional ArsR family regulator